MFGDQGALDLCISILEFKSWVLGESMKKVNNLCISILEFKYLFYR